jgi:cystathionine beta-lyase/cystathionine gamma-synthase
VCGVIVTDSGSARRIQSLVSQVGGTVSPLDAWLTVRGIRTLDVRVRRAGGNALEIAGRLTKHRAVLGVNYPGLKPWRDRARRLLDGGFGAMLSFEVRGGLKAARKFVRALGMIRLLPSLGDVQTTVSHPARTSHSYLTPAERAEVGVTDGLIRISTGIEHVDDIWADLNQALTRSQK